MMKLFMMLVMIMSTTDMFVPTCVQVWGTQRKSFPSLSDH